MDKNVLSGIHYYRHASNCTVTVVSSRPQLCVCVYLSAAEDKMGWHGKPLPKDMADSVIKELQSRIISCNKRIYPAPPNEDASPVSLRNIRMPSAPSYKLGDKV